MKKKERDEEKRTAPSPPDRGTDRQTNPCNPTHPSFFPSRLTSVTLGYQILVFCGDLPHYAQSHPVRNIRFFFQARI